MLQRRPHRHAHDVVKIAFNALNDPLGVLLNPISTSLIKRINQPVIGADRFIIHRFEGNLTHGVKGMANPSRRDDRHTGTNDVRPAGQTTHHRVRLVKITRFGQWHSIQKHQGVGTNHKRIRMPIRHRQRLGRGVVQAQLLRRKGKIVIHFIGVG